MASALNSVSLIGLPLMAWAIDFSMTAVMGVSELTGKALLCLPS